MRINVIIQRHGSYSVTEARLTDGSLVYAVEFLSGAALVVLECVSERQAREIAEALHLGVVDVSIR